MRPWQLACGNLHRALSRREVSVSALEIVLRSVRAGATLTRILDGSYRLSLAAVGELKASGLGWLDRPLTRSSREVEQACASVYRSPIDRYALSRLAGVASSAVAATALGCPALDDDQAARVLASLPRLKDSPVRVAVDAAVSRHGLSYDCVPSGDAGGE